MVDFVSDGAPAMAGKRMVLQQKLKKIENFEDPLLYLAFIVSFIRKHCVLKFKDCSRIGQ
jgi:hypothetical protein